MSTAAIPVHVALVDESGKIGQAELEKVAGALSEQIAADFAPAWHVRATVGAYSKAPAGTWAVKVQRKLDEPGALGYHTDDSHQPYALVEYTADWSVTVSHEVLEMLADPWGSRLHRAELPDGLNAHFADFGLRSERSYVRYLLEVCDPPEAHSYVVGGVNVSDFLLPPWYRTNPSPALVYSFAGGCSQPRHVIPGGYVSFENLASGEWYQVFNEGGTLQVQDLGKFGREGRGARPATLREWTDYHARTFRAERAVK